MKKTALVTGGNRGIGEQVCRELTGAGRHVLLAARDRTLETNVFGPLRVTEALLPALNDGAFALPSRPIRGIGAGRIGQLLVQGLAVPQAAPEKLRPRWNRRQRIGLLGQEAPERRVMPAERV